VQDPLERTLENGKAVVEELGKATDSLNGTHDEIIATLNELEDIWEPTRETTDARPPVNIGGSRPLGS